MPDTKTAPALEAEAEAENNELADIEASVRAFDEAGLRAALTSEGLSNALIELVVSGQKRENETNKRLLQRGQREDTARYQGTLRDQFPYAFDEKGAPLFAGTTKAEMRRAAERLHNHTAAIVGTVSKAAPAAAGAPNARAEAWQDLGGPPAGAPEVVRETPDATWDQLRSDAIHKPATQGEQTKRDIIADLKKNSPRQMQRASLAQIASRQSVKAARDAAANKA